MGPDLDFPSSRQPRRRRLLTNHAMHGLIAREVDITMHDHIKMVLRFSDLI